MKPVIKDNGKSIISTPMCGKCGKTLHYYEYKDERGIPCINPRVIVENFCSNCGEKVEGYSKMERVRN